MPNFEVVSLEEAIRKSALAGRRGDVLREYLGYVDQMEEGQAGKLRVSEAEDPAAVRRSLGAAAKLAGKRLVIKRVGEEIYFWAQPPEAATRGRRRGRRPAGP